MKYEQPTAEALAVLRDEARRIGVFLPLHESTGAIDSGCTLHGHDLKNRAALLMQPVFDADETGAPTEATTARYCEAVRRRCCGQVWTEPVALTPESREDPHQLMLTPENQGAFMAFLYAVRQASRAAWGSAPVFTALLDHAGERAVSPVCLEENGDTPLLTDDDLTMLIVQSGVSAKCAEAAGFEGIALNASDRRLFGASLAAYHRDGRFGGDFDDRTRFFRDCCTAMKVAAPKPFLAVCMSLSDGIPQPDGWGMAFEDESHPDLYEPALLMRILNQLYGAELILCRIGIPGVNWMAAEEPEPEIVRISRLCTCIAMLDSDLQQNASLIVPEMPAERIPFANLAAGMIAGEFASFAGFAG